MTWLYFALGTVVCWGLYGIFLHKGQVAMGGDSARWKAFLFVGIAYFLTAVLLPLVILFVKNGQDGAESVWKMPTSGVTWSLVAGLVGAAGAFFVLLALARQSPTAVMSIVFAGAPIVNALVGICLLLNAGKKLNMPWQFIAGIVLAAAGGCLVTIYKPGPGAKKAPAVVAPADAGEANQ